MKSYYVIFGFENAGKSMLAEMAGEYNTLKTGLLSPYILNTINFYDNDNEEIFKYINSIKDRINKTATLLNIVKDDVVKCALKSVITAIESEDPDPHSAQKRAEHYINYNLKMFKHIIQTCRKLEIRVKILNMSEIPGGTILKSSNFLKEEIKSYDLRIRKEHVEKRQEILSQEEHVELVKNRISELEKDTDPTIDLKTLNIVATKAILKNKLSKYLDIKSDFEI